MVRFALAVMLAVPMFPQAARDLYMTHCSGCHGPYGEGSRGPALRRPALQRANDIDSLVVLLRSGVPGTEMAGISSRVLADEQLRLLAGFVLKMRMNVTDAAAGSVDRGAELFRGKGKCVQCHRVNGAGRASGPDLSDIGRRRDTAWLRRAVVQPEAAIFDSFSDYRWTIQIPDNYLLVEITTPSGERVTGSRLNEDPFSIQIRDDAGRIRSFLKSEIAGLRKHWGKSPMPSYAQQLTAAEIEDIVAYLASLRGTR